MAEEKREPFMSPAQGGSPFRIHGFHSDSGSEFINHRIARLIEKLRISEFIKSRASRTADNALVEGRNGAARDRLLARCRALWNRLGCNPVPRQKEGRSTAASPQAHS